MKLPRLSLAVKPTTPGLTINNRYLRHSLRGRSYMPKTPGSTHKWGVSNLPTMSITKSANMSPETKHELVQTGVIGAIGAGTSAVTHRLMAKGLVGNTAAKAAVIGGGLGLLGDYVAVKLNKKIGPQSITKQSNEMNKVASILRERASELRISTPELVAINLLKQAGMSEEDARYEVAQKSMEKVAAEQLTYRGIDAEEAASLVKSAKIDVRSLSSMSLVSEEETLADILEKTANYIEAQEEKIAALEAKTGELEKVAHEAAEAVTQAESYASTPVLPDSIEKMASVGALSFEDIEALKAIPQETLSKVASAIDQPWEMGKAHGTAQGTGDPILDFCMS